jgi:nucleoside-diphosphate-sugar epimerase
MPAQPHVLLTGGAGVVGQALVRRLSEQDLTCLVHRRPVPGAGMTVRGDIAQPRLGLSAADHRELAARTDVVVHAAAIADFTFPDDTIRATNVDGTQRILEFCAAADARLVHVSTAYAALESGDHLPAPTRLREAELTLDKYLESKRAAEDVVTASGVPAAIVRLPIVAGHSQTGWIAHFQAIYLFARYLMIGALPFLPVYESARMDGVPCDVIADALAELVATDHSGRAYWATAGVMSLPVAEFVELCLDFADERLGRRPPAPRFVDPTIVDRLLRPVLIPRVPMKMKIRLEGFFQFLRVLDHRRPFPSDLAALVGDDPVPDPAETMRRSLAYWYEEAGAALMTQDDLGNALAAAST